MKAFAGSAAAENMTAFIRFKFKILFFFYGIQRLNIDYNTVIVHIFTPEQREFYGRDNMWKDGKEIDLSDILDEAEGD